MRKLDLIALIAVLGLGPAAFADQVSLKNGDHLSGTIVKSDGKTLVLHTDYAGDVTLDFKAITQITSEKELHVTTSDKKTFVGPVTTTDGKIEVVTKANGNVEVPQDQVALIRNDAEQTAYDICGALAAREDEIPFEKGTGGNAKQMVQETDMTPMDVPLHPGAERWLREYS